MSGPRTGLLAGGAVLTFVGSTYASFLLNKADKVTTSGDRLPSAEERVAKYDDISKVYDSKISMDETMMGMWLLRRFLVGGNAAGDVLEVAAGTGRNYPYYQSTCKSLTITDASKPMLEVAVDVGKQKGLAVPISMAVKARAEDLRSALGGRKFDTVVDTFGLCSFEDPVEALRQMQACCEPEGGKILLLEHGKSSWLPWLTKILDNQAVQHATNWGCVWNRDIERIVEESGLKVESLHTFHFGTTYYIIGRPGAQYHRREEANVTATSVARRHSKNSARPSCCSCHGHGSSAK